LHFGSFKNIFGHIDWYIFHYDIIHETFWHLSI
jgi:hypothetical protein